VTESPRISKFRTTVTTAVAGKAVNASASTKQLPIPVAGNPLMNGLPADFDPEYYLVINADVKEAGLDPVQHYLNFGRAEGRIYRS